MNTTFQSVGFTASEHLKRMAQQKVQKLFHQNDKIIRTDVALRLGASRNSKNQFCEINVSLPGYNLFVKKNSELFEKSLNLAIEALRKVIRRGKSKELSARKRKGVVI